MTTKKHFVDDNFQKYKKLVHFVSNYEGVPYKHGGRNMLGIDCVGFIQLCCYELDIITEVVDAGHYPKDWYLKNENAMIESIDWYLNNFLADGISYEETTDFQAIRSGDLVCYKINSPVVNHVAISLVRGMIAHANLKARKITVESGINYRSFFVKAYQFYEDLEESQPLPVEPEIVGE